MKQAIFQELLTLPSEQKSVKLIEPIIDKLRAAVDLHIDLYYDLIITCTEAVNNAIIHGNKCDLEKKVNFELCANHDLIEVTVRDEGNGFDPESVSNPLEAENLFKSSGRGIFIIKELSNRTNIISTPNGTTVCFTFEIE